MRALWIIVANSWMHTPTGFHIVTDGGHAHVEICDFWDMFFNPSMVDRFLHVMVGAYLSGTFLAIGISAYYLIKKKCITSSKILLSFSLFMGFGALILQLVTGDMSARATAQYAPERLAAYEGIFQTQRGAPLTLFGIVNAEKEKVEYQIAIPKLLSFLVSRHCNAKISGLDQIPQEDRPNVTIVFQAYHVMLVVWGIMVACVVAGFLWLPNISEKKGLLKVLIFSAIIPQIGNQAGWVAVEMGRFPWIVYKFLRISEGVSQNIPAQQVVGSIIFFATLYFFLFILYLYLLRKKILEGPEA